MNSLSIKAKIACALAVLTFFMLLVGLLGYRNSVSEGHVIDQLFSKNFEAQTQLAEINKAQLLINSEVAVALLTRSDEVTRKMQLRVQELREEITAGLAKYQATITTPEERQLLEQLVTKRTELVSENNKAIKLINDKQYDQAQQIILHEVMALQQAVDDASNALLSYQTVTGRSLAKTTEASVTSNNTWVLILILASLAMAVVIAKWLIKVIVNGLQRVLSMAQNIAGGQLDNHIDIHSKDEFGQLAAAMLTMDKKLSEIVSHVVSGAQAVGAAAGELALGNDDLSNRTQEQASALEETASSMEQMTATVKQTADNARQASQLAMAARTQANESGSVVSAAVNAMNEINQSSRRIADIISVIDEIAFQTNLLALNAAVEAARAGEQGRGFAVVASEVRNLAQRSATAAKEIKGLINDSVQKVADGTALVDRSGQTLADIVEGIKKLTDVVAEISAASQEQAAGIDQVNNAITQMDQTTQQNAALVEQATSASKAMEDNAQQLVEVVGFFKTARNHTDALSHRAPRGTQTRSYSSMPVLLVKKARPVAVAAPRARVSGANSSWTEF